ncbi:hypothetical protein GCM10010510_65730 [Streptomyces anandii JCM 4720]|nr:hypothetical protein GCM10010510_65730 [Streptomyces anandii JCM 4720]
MPDDATGCIGAAESPHARTRRETCPTKITNGRDPGGGAGTVAPDRRPPSRLARIDPDDPFIVFAVLYEGQSLGPAELSAARGRAPRRHTRGPLRRGNARTL